MSQPLRDILLTGIILAIITNLVGAYVYAQLKNAKKKRRDITMPCPFCNLIADTNNPTWIADMEHTVALVNLEQTYRGRSILVLKQHYDDLLSVPKELFDEVNTEMLKLASAIEKSFCPDRLNFAILGNEVSHVHWHIIPRYKTDQNWGRSPWPIGTRVSLPDEEYRRLADLLRSALLNNSSM